jgi:hypothetical protein
MSFEPIKLVDVASGQFYLEQGSKHSMGGRKRPRWRWDSTQTRPLRNSGRLRSLTRPLQLARRQIHAADASFRFV